MSFLAPLALLLLAPLGLAGLALWRLGPGLAGGLPGDWGRLVDPPLRRHLAAGVAGRDRSRLALLALAAGLIVVALARPVVERAGAGDYAIRAGRVIAIGMAAGVDPAPQRLLARTLIAAAPETPTAIVAVGGAGYDVAPLTTDISHLDRYLSVLDPALMPEAGRRPEAGLAHAEALLARAGIVVGQVVFLPAAPPAPGVAAPPARGRLRAVLARREIAAAWEARAADWGARLAGPEEIGAVRGDLEDAARAVRLSETPDGAFELRPWLAGGAALCWLGLFRRRSGR